MANVNINERLLELRTELGLSQEDFGNKIKLSKFSISNFESGKRNLSPRIIADICREFNVSETWLRTGQGEKFTEIPTETIDQLASEYNLPLEAKNLIKNFIKLDEKEMNLVINVVKKLAANNNDDTLTADDISATLEEAPQNNDNWSKEREQVLKAVAQQEYFDKKYNNVSTKKESLSALTIIGR